MLIPLSKRQAITVHTGGQQGFNKAAMLLFKSQEKSDDYHNNMNPINFIKWERENTKLISQYDLSMLWIINIITSNLTKFNTRKQHMYECRAWWNRQFTYRMLYPEL
jgi:hypothetical protein